MNTYEYEVTCDWCGRTFTIGLTVPAEQIRPESLARMVDALHVGDCPVGAP